jgi:hypothetical protein
VAARRLQPGALQVKQVREKGRHAVSDMKGADLLVGLLKTKLACSLDTCMLVSTLKPILHVCLLQHCLRDLTRCCTTQGGCATTHCTDLPSATSAFWHFYNQSLFNSFRHVIWLGCESKVLLRVATPIFRVGQNHIYTVYIRYFWLGNHQKYDVFIRIYTVLANPTYLSFLSID